MKTKKFKVGDIVRLKSGGPDMTVSQDTSQLMDGKYLCQWFSGKKLEDGRFSEESLIVPQKDEGKKKEA